MNWEWGAMRCTAFVTDKGEIRIFTVVKVPRHRPLVLLVTVGWKEVKAAGRGISNTLEVDCCILICSVFRVLVLVRSTIGQ
jgi:hypothetical protein